MLFNDVEFLYLSKLSKKPVEIIVNINHKCTTLFMKGTTKVTVEGFVHPSTGYLITDTFDRKDIKEGVDQKSAHRKYMDLALDYARLRSAEFLTEILSLSPEQYQEAGYKDISKLKLEFEKALNNEIKIEKHILGQLAVVRSKDMPEPNQFIVFDNEPLDQLVTGVIPYSKPKPYRDVLIDTFLNVFFEDEDKEFFSWYMGAVLHNISMCDYTFRKMMIVTSAISGAGKSTLVNSIVNNVVTPTYARILSEYDSYFTSDSRFNTASLPSTRLLVFNEASWGKEKKDHHPHDFTGMNTAAIKSILTEGYLDEEPKYGTRQTTVKHSAQIVLSNYLPAIKSADFSIERRLLPVLVKPTSMIEKVEQLGLFGEAFEEFVFDNREKFCAYFLQAYLDNPRLVMDFIYDYDTYRTIFEGERRTRHTQKSTIDQQIHSLTTVHAVLEYTKEEHNADIDNIVTAIEEHIATGTEHSDLVRYEDGILWFNSSSPVLSRYTTTPNKIKNVFRTRYGPTHKKFNARRYQIPYSKVG